MPKLMSKERLIGQLEFRLYHHFEKYSLETPIHQARFLPTETFNKAEVISAIFNQGLSWQNALKRIETPQIMMIALAGEFTSIDQFRLKGIHANLAGLQVDLQFIRVNSEDGTPFPANHFLLIPLNASMLAYQRLTINFEAIEKDFAGYEQPAPHIQIAPFEIQ